MNWACWLYVGALGFAVGLVFKGCKELAKRGREGRAKKEIEEKKNDDEL